MKRAAVDRLSTRQRRARAGGSASVWRSVGTPTALRCSGPWPRCRTHFACCARFVQTTATGQRTTRAARAATTPGLAGRAGPGGPAVRKAQTVPRTVCVPAHLLGATQAHCRLPGRAFAGTVWVFQQKQCRCLAAGGAWNTMHAAVLKRDSATARRPFAPFDRNLVDAGIFGPANTPHGPAKGGICGGPTEANGQSVRATGRQLGPTSG